MKITVNRKDLSDALEIAAGASSVRTAHPVLASIKLHANAGALTLTGCDGEMWAQAVAPALIAEEGSVCVQQKLLSDVVGQLPEGEVQVSLEGTQVFLRIGVSEWKLMAFPADEFPPIPETNATGSLSLKFGQLTKGLASVMYAISDDTSRPVLTGILFSYDSSLLTLVATDTHRMAVHRIAQEGIGSDVTAIVPGKALRVVRSLKLGADDEINLGFEENRIVVDIGSAKIVAQLLVGQYPNWERVVPAECTRMWTMDRDELTVNVRRAMILARDSANRVRFSGQGEKVVISARSEDKGEAKEEVAMVAKNGDVDIAFNGRYVIEALGALEGEGVRAEMTESSRPAVLRPTDSDETFCVVMPMAMG